ncbi:MAG: hypothetical protein ACYC44_02640 [Patescibacteria group bacterium]
MNFAIRIIREKPSSDCDQARNALWALVDRRDYLIAPFSECEACRKHRLHHNRLKSIWVGLIPLTVLTIALASGLWPTRGHNGYLFGALSAFLGLLMAKGYGFLCEMRARVKAHHEIDSHRRPHERVAQVTNLVLSTIHFNLFGTSGMMTMIQERIDHLMERAWEYQNEIREMSPGVEINPDLVLLHGFLARLGKLNVDLHRHGQLLDECLKTRSSLIHQKLAVAKFCWQLPVPTPRCDEEFLSEVQCIYCESVTIFMIHERAYQETKIAAALKKAAASTVPDLKLAEETLRQYLDALPELATENTPNSAY